MKPIVFILIAMIVFIIFKKDPMLVLFLVGAYLIYRYLAGNMKETEKNYFSSMSNMALTLTRSMSLLIEGLDQIKLSINHLNSQNNADIIANEDDPDEFEHLI